MTGINIRRVGHVALDVRDLDESIDWYVNKLGMTLTGRWPLGGGIGEMAYLRFNDDHHNLALFQVKGADMGGGDPRMRASHFALELANRDDWLAALGELKRRGVEIERGPMIHGPEGGEDNEIGGSGSRSFYIRDAEGNSIELYCDMMRVPDGDPFPRKDYEDLETIFG